MNRANRAPIIDTGSSANRVSSTFRPVHDAATALVAECNTSASLYAYGSVVTGQATAPTSDVDLLTIGLSPDHAAQIAHTLSAQFTLVCRCVEIAAARPGDFSADTDEAYGNRVFLRHYCVLLTGPDDLRPSHDFAGDRRAARGFNGDIARHARQWQSTLDADVEPASVVGRRMARKSLLAVAGLVSVNDRRWTTDRSVGAQRWGEVEPSQRPGLEQLLSWTSQDLSKPPSTAEVRGALDSTVKAIVSEFGERIGLWPDTTSPR